MSSYVDQLKQYQNFEDVSELKKAFNLFRKVFRYELTEADNKVLFEMTGYAAKFAGACKLKLETIEKVTGLSLSTVRRAISKAEKLGIIKRFKTRKDGGRRQGTTVYQFQQFNSNLLPEQQDEHLTMNSRQNDEKPCESKNEAAKNGTEALSSLSPSLSFKDTNITKKRTEKDSVDKELLKKKALIEKLPNALQGLSIYSNDSDMIYKLVSSMLSAKNKVSNTIKFEEHEALFRKTIRSVYEYWTRQVRKGKEDYNVFGLMYKAVKELCERILDGSAYQVQENVSKAPKRKTENVPAWMADKVKAFENGRSEMVPDWFNDRNEEVKPMAAVSENIDFEAERQKVLAKLFG